ncbi:hypothetical protein CMUS01_16480 [Colletotrichum musicola]|uniref:Uncharacterized protein n=1 Tax=Colletotrichum musicola TaxID=2175873 RepID=A0A8H6MI14_9PEZI|nr:hypothetical protein CMUS01_16480 [Colletotrichum musicola]
MQLTRLLPVAAVLALVPAVCARGVVNALPTSTDAAEYLSDINMPTTFSGAQATSLASALYSVDLKYLNDEKYTTMFSHMVSAAAKATDGPDRAASIVVNGFDIASESEEKYWKDNMPSGQKDYVSKYVSEFQAAATKFLATETSKGAAPRCTGMAVAGVAAGLAAGVMAVM